MIKKILIFLLVLAVIGGICALVHQLKVAYKNKKELGNKIYPPLAGEMPDVKGYDTIFVGGPVWWYTMATPLYSLLEQMDFKNKKVIPFSTQGSNPGSFLEDFKSGAKNAQVSTYANFNNVGPEYNQAVHNKIVHWLNNL